MKSLSTGPTTYLCGGRRALFLHPVLVFSAVWLGVSFLYSLHLSEILQYPTSDALTVAAYIWLPFAGIASIFSLVYHLRALTYPVVRPERTLDAQLLDRRLTVWFRVWAVISVAEIAVSGGMPIIWLVTGSSKTYMDFGISSVHGLVNSLLTSVAICRWALFLITKSRRHLAIPVFTVLWSIAAVTRNLMIVALLEFAVIYLQMRPIRRSTVVKFVAVGLCLVLAFGLIGDLRQGSSDAIRVLARPTENYPDWLPSGVLWAYIYITSPINNLIYTMQVTHPINSLLFPYTAATLFPTVIRSIVYSGESIGNAESGSLVDAAFNVSTAYIGPYQDYGILGMVLFSAFAAILCQVFWYRKSLQSVLMFAVVLQCLVLTLFFNHFFTLPVISQLAWLGYFFSPGLLARGS
jgi:oligosaccharide repeat unit polymerase